jgi:hypothetical protein
MAACEDDGFREGLNPTLRADVRELNSPPVLRDCQTGGAKERELSRELIIPHARLLGIQELQSDIYAVKEIVCLRLWIDLDVSKISRDQDTAAMEGIAVLFSNLMNSARLGSGT